MGRVMGLWAGGVYRKTMIFLIDVGFCVCVCEEK